MAMADGHGQWRWRWQMVMVNGDGDGDGRFFLLFALPALARPWPPPTGGKAGNSLHLPLRAGPFGALPALACSACSACSPAEAGDSLAYSLA